jgi:hypothetical protein
MHGKLNFDERGQVSIPEDRLGNRSRLVCGQTIEQIARDPNVVLDGDVVPKVRRHHASDQFVGRHAVSS